MIGLGKTKAKEAAKEVGVVQGKSQTAMAVDPEETPLKEGWLLKRGPMFAYGWEKRWCVLYKKAFIFYADEQRKTKKGDSIILPASKATAFMKSDAPGEAIKHRAEHPHGLVLDADPGGGPNRVLYYFDAQNDRLVKEWVLRINATAKQLLGTAKWPAGCDAAAMPAPGPNGQLGEVDRLLDGLHDQAIFLGDEAKKQAGLVDKVQESVDKAQGTLDSHNERAKHLLAEEPPPKGGSSNPMMAAAMNNPGVAAAAAPVLIKTAMQ